MIGSLHGSHLLNFIFLLSHSCLCSCLCPSRDASTRVRMSHQQLKQPFMNWQLSEQILKTFTRFYLYLHCFLKMLSLYKCIFKRVSFSWTKADVLVTCFYSKKQQQHQKHVLKIQRMKQFAKNKQQHDTIQTVLGKNSFRTVKEKGFYVGSDSEFMIWSNELFCHLPP